MSAFAAGSLALRMLARSRVRLVLSVAGIALAVFLLSTERAIQTGVAEATGAQGRETRLIVYRANRFCPFTSKLPERYAAEIESIAGVRSAVPMQIAVSNCRASLDVVVFRGVRTDDAVRVLAPRLTVLDGSIAAFLSRGDAAMVGRALAERRRLAVGDRFQSAGIAVTVAAIVEAEGPQDRNACFVQLPFLQQSTGALQGGDVTQFEVEVASSDDLDRVAREIDALFAADAAPTTTRAERAFAARAADDLVTLAAFAGWLGLGALVAVFALVANAIALSLESRVRELAVLQAIGFRGQLLGVSILLESAVLATIGGAIGGAAAYIALHFGKFGLGAEGIVIEFRPSFATTLAAIGAALVAGTLAGMLPALRVARRPIVEGLRAA